MPPPDSCSVLTAGSASQQLWETYIGCRSNTASPSKSQLWCTKLFIVAVHRTWLTSSRSAQPTVIGSSAPLRPEQPRYRELGSSSDGLSLSAVRRVEQSSSICPQRRLHSSFRRALKTHLFQLAFNKIDCFYFLIYHFWLCNARPAGFYLVWLGTITFLS